MYNNMNNIAYLEKYLQKSDDFLTIGTDESEWVKGYVKFMTGVKKQAEVILDAKVVKSDPQVYVEGTVAWFNDKVTLTVNNGEVKIRATGVLHKENGIGNYCNNTFQWEYQMQILLLVMSSPLNKTSNLKLLLFF